MDSLPLEIRLAIASYLPHTDFFNLCYALESCGRRSRAYSRGRIHSIVRKVRALIIALKSSQNLEDVILQLKARIEEGLYDFYLTLLTSRGVELCYPNSDVSILHDPQVVSDRLPTPLFLAWHKARFNNRRAAKQVRLAHSHGSRNCGVCAASRSIARYSIVSLWHTGGWPVIRDNGDSTATYIDILHSTSFSPLDLLRYPGNYDFSSYHILWTYGQAIVSEQILNLEIILDSDDRSHVDNIAHRYAHLIAE